MSMLEGAHPLKPEVSTSGRLKKAHQKACASILCTSKLHADSHKSLSAPSIQEHKCSKDESVHLFYFLNN